ncbi:serine hydrolase domain-containing protein [Qipengyuania gelatinilytica]|uniref:Beta-lactamase family protein n=1 Tax=Qipengyuania gelatinilytica TaxID=2867231 RepID=A0ABX9A6T1_9SPHN|nr:serine hydrolase [Qipengyuania gelatinilytica]QZD95623.1 beta-lactamase family protein [Qipengyuania gelatinilytica]
MIRTALAAATLLAATPALAQSTTQDEIDARYDRALAAGYKALFLCSAIANAERNGATRTPESIERWELVGIQSPLDKIVAELDFEIHRRMGWMQRVEVVWADDASARVAVTDGRNGCHLQPIGTIPADDETVALVKGGTGPGKLISLPWGAERSSRHFYRVLRGTADRAFAGDYGEGTRTTAVLVKRRGQVFERYADDFGPLTPQRTWSVAKSIAATLVGAAQLRGETDVQRRTGITGWADDARRAVTIDQLLRMSSGRYSDTPGNRTDPLYFGGSTVEETALHWSLVSEPGTIYRYANNDTLAAIKAIEETFETNPPSAFLAKIGMNDTVAETDWQGDYILSSQVWATARDLARLGQLYLDDGVLPDGTRILPEGWVEYVSTPSGPQPDGPFGYGAGFWLLNKSEGIPPDTIAAMGNRGQFIIIVPSLNVVIVRRGEDPAGSRFDIASFTRDVLESITN